MPNKDHCVRAGTPSFGLISIHMIIIRLRLETRMQVTVDVDE
jgi:hypothetical protein